MTLSDYQIFVTVAKHHSLTLCAETLHLTKSAVSHSIAKMEKELGLPLFSRSNREVALTFFGEKLLPFAVAVLKEHKKFEAQVNSFSNSRSGIVRLGTVSSICINWIPDIINSFRKAYPGVEIQLRAGACNRDMVEWLLENETDIGLGTTDPIPDLNFEFLHNDEMIALTPLDFTAENITYITAEELRELPLLMQEPPYNEEVIKVQDRLNLNIKAMITGYDDNTLISMVESGMGCCIMGKLVMRRISAAVRAYSFNPRMYRQISLIRKKNITHSSAVNEMCRFIKKYTKDFPQDYELNLLDSEIQM